jgi:betaine-aldehyde dehydrogenase
MTMVQLELPRPKLWIDGDWTDADDGSTFATINPATEERIGEIACGGAADIDRAVKAARREFDGGAWSRVSGADRGRLLLRIARLVDAHREEIAQLEALEIGKPVGDTLAIDLKAMVETFEYYAGWADKILGTQVPVPDVFGHPRLCYTVREPVGVVGAITPWNSPAMIASWKLAAALAVGCTSVLKPPEDASLSTLRLAELLEEAELPPGVVSVVPGLGPDAGAALVAHPQIDKVSFTGSPEVGAEIARVAGAQFKRVTLELGGKSPQIVFADADLDKARRPLAAAIFANQGEVCAAGSRVIVHRSRQQEVSDWLVSAAQGFTLGDPFDQATTMGPLVNQAQMRRVLGYVDAGKAEGAELLTGGTRAGERGFFVTPTVFCGTNTMSIARDEIFGPVGTIIPFDEPEEALRLANDTRYGLSAMVWTENLATGHRAAMGIRSGAVWVNGWGPPDPRVPHGGMKTSGVGRELGLAGLYANTEEKVVQVVL